MKFLLLSVLFISNSFSQDEAPGSEITSLYNKLNLSFNWYTSTIDAIDSNNLSVNKVSNNIYSFEMYYLFNTGDTFYIGPYVNVSTHSYKDQETLTFTNKKLRPVRLGLEAGYDYLNSLFHLRLLYQEEVLIRRISLSQVELLEDNLLSAHLFTEFKFWSSENFIKVLNISAGTGLTETSEVSYKMGYEAEISFGYEYNKVRHQAFFLKAFYNVREHDNGSTKQTTESIGLKLGGSWW